LIHEAELLRLWDPLSLDDLVARHPGSRGIGKVRIVLAELRAGAGITRSELEELFLAFVDRIGLPRPRTNATVVVRGVPIEVDCLWEQRRVIVELDGHHVHGTRRNYEGDRSRDRALQAAGWQVIRVTWRQLEREADAV